MVFLHSSCFSCELIWIFYYVHCSRLRVCPKTSITPPMPFCQCSLHCLTTLLSTSLEMTLCVSEVLLSLELTFHHLPFKVLTQCLSVFSASSVDDLQISCYRLMCSIYSLGTVKTPHVEKWVSTSLNIWKPENKSLTSFLHQFKLTVCDIWLCQVNKNVYSTKSEICTLIIIYNAICIINH